MKTNMCLYSGKPIGNRDAVLAEYAKDYLRKLGYLVSNKAFQCLFVFIMLLYGLSMVSAEVYHLSSYNTETQTVVIKNSLNADTTYIKLNTPLVYNVPLGYQKVAELNISSYEAEYIDSFVKIKTYNANDLTKEINRTFDYKLLTYVDVWIPTYNQTLGHYEKQEKWVDYDPKLVSNGYYTLGLFTNVNKGDRVEWIPEFYGVKISQWATWVQEGHGKTISGSGGYTAKAGTSIGVNTTFWLGSVSLLAGANPTNLYIDFYNGTPIFNLTIDGSVATLPTPFKMEAGGEYDIYCDALGGSYTAKYISYANWPVAETDFIWFYPGQYAGYYDGHGNDNLWNLLSLNYSLDYGLDRIPPTFVDIPANVSLFYGNSTGVLGDFSANDETSPFFANFTINDSRFLIGYTTGILSNNTPMAVGNYAVNVTINDSSNNINWTIFLVNVKKSQYYDCGVYFNTTSGITYPDLFEVYTNCSSAYTLYQNGTSISNATAVNSGAGYYNYTVQRTDSLNYTNTIFTNFFKVNQATSEVYAYVNNVRGNYVGNATSLFMNGTLQVGVGNIEMWYCGNLINNGTSPLFNDTSTSISYCNFQVYTEGNQNYSSATEIWTVNVQEGASTIWWQVNLESHMTILILAVFFIVALLLIFVFHRPIFGGALLILLGFILLFSSFNVILSFVIIAGGVIALFLK